MLRLGDPGEFAMWLAIGMGLLGLFFGPIGTAIGRRIAGGKPKDESATGLTTGEMTAERVAAMEDRIQELEGERVQLEERLDFAERMLTRGQADTRQPAPGGEG